MSFIVVGTNHRYSPVELREGISFSKRSLKDAMSFLKERHVLKGAVILSTCNRVEIYANEGAENGTNEIESFISRYFEIGRQRLSRYLYIYRDMEALRHLFYVATGLDSLILGETQILRQVKNAFLESEKLGFTNSLLKEIFYSAIYLSKKIHQDTRISEGKVSVGSVAIDFIKERTGSLSGRNILIIGVGKVTELVLRYLKKERSNVVFISNRTFEKAKDLAGRIGAKAVRFDEFKQHINRADIVITATASPHFIIKKEAFEGIGRKLLILDLALPRDIEPEAGELENVDLFYLEDLDTVIGKNREKRGQEAKKAAKIIGIEVGKLWEKITESAQEPALLP